MQNIYQFPVYANVCMELSFASPAVCYNLQQCVCVD